MFCWGLNNAFEKKSPNKNPRCKGRFCFFCCCLTVLYLRDLRLWVILGKAAPLKMKCYFSGKPFSKWNVDCNGFIFLSYFSLFCHWFFPCPKLKWAFLSPLSLELPIVQKQFVPTTGLTRWSRSRKWCSNVWIRALRIRLWKGLKAPNCSKRRRTGTRNCVTLKA